MTDIELIEVYNRMKDVPMLYDKPSLRYLTLEEFIMMVELVIVNRKKIDG